jgi:diguanylate cyclase (GGDEF)-like protein
MSLGPLDNTTIAALSASRQFGHGPFHALLAQAPENNDEIALDDHGYFVKRRVVDSVGWSIVLMQPTNPVISYRIFGIIIVMIFCVIMLCFFVALEKSLEAAAQIAVTESRFRVLFEGAPGAIFIIDKETRKIISANPFMNEWLNYRPGELFALTLADIRIAGAGETPGEFRYRKRDGALIDVVEVRREISFQGKMADLIIAHDISDRKRAEELLYTLSMADGLTGIANRRRFNDFLTQEWRRAIREGSEISLIMCDIDFFKNYNDSYGHQAGDDCLKRVAEAISQTFHRPGDIAARYGGEEFAVIMSGTGLHDALSLAQVVRAAVEALGIAHGSSAVAPVVTLSLGVATIKPQKETSFESLIAAADQALYHAKSRGRNQVQISAV